MRGDKLTVTVHELGAGQRTAPYHFEYGNEEWAIVLEGRPTLRDPDGERQLEPGDLVGFRRGPEGAHELRNAQDAPARVLIVCSTVQPSVTVYPDDGTLEVTPPGKLFAEADALPTPARPRPAQLH
jgi:uncharacterized cupin superfamily protein